MLTPRAAVDIQQGRGASGTLSGSAFAASELSRHAFQHPAHGMQL